MSVARPNPATLMRNNTARSGNNKAASRSTVRSWGGLVTMADCPDNLLCFPPECVGSRRGPDVCNPVLLLSRSRQAGTRGPGNSQWSWELSRLDFQRAGNTGSCATSVSLKNGQCVRGGSYSNHRAVRISAKTGTNPTRHRRCLRRSGFCEGRAGCDWRAFRS